jgi:hypothetical protein
MKVLRLLAFSSLIVYVYTACSDDKTTQQPECECDCENHRGICKYILRQDYYYCGCSYCNFDEASKQCIGNVDDEFGSCLNKIPQPSSDSDCEAYSCKPNYDIITEPDMGVQVVGCNRGGCLASGKACYMTIVPQFSLYHYTLKCVCQDDNDSTIFKGDPYEFYKSLDRQIPQYQTTTN